MLSRLEPSEKDRLMAMVKNDRADSSDEEAERNPMEQKYNDFGREVKRIARANSSQATAAVAANGPGFYKGNFKDSRLESDCVLHSLHTFCTVFRQQRFCEQTSGLQQGTGVHSEPLQLVRKQSLAPEYDAGKVFKAPCD